LNKTAVVLGNGKSLLSIPDGLLDTYESFGTNYIHLSGIQPTYFVCVDTIILTQHPTLIYNTVKNAKKTFLNNIHVNDANQHTRMLYKLPNVTLIGKDTDAFSECMYMSGYSAVYVALKMAYYEGFKRVLLYGVDHDRDWNHFATNYPPGVKTTELRRDIIWWHLRYANEVYKKDGRQIINYSAPSDLDKFFERV
jgi:hypothetical protein